MITSMLRIGVILVFIIIFGYVWIWYRRKENKLTAYTKDLQKNPCEDTLQKYIHHLCRTKIPDEYQFWGVLRQAYEVVMKQADQFQPETIEQFKQCLRQKGVRWVE
jgi:hypothetical protein